MMMMMMRTMMVSTMTMIMMIMRRQRPSSMTTSSIQVLTDITHKQNLELGIPKIILLAFMNTLDRVCILEDNTDKSKTIEVTEFS